MPGAEAADQHGGHDHQGADRAIGAKARRIGEGTRPVALLQDEAERGGRHDHAAEIDQHGALGQEAGARVIVACQLRAQRSARHLVEGDEESHAHGETHQIPEQAELAEIGRRVPQHVIGDTDRQDRGVHEKVTPAETAARIVRQEADYRVAEGIEQECKQQRDADHARGQPEGLRIAEHQEIAEAIAFHAIGDAAYGIGQPRERSEPGGHVAAHGGPLPTVPGSARRDRRCLTGETPIRSC